MSASTGAIFISRSMTHDDFEMAHRLCGRDACFVEQLRRLPCKADVISWNWGRAALS